MDASTLDALRTLAAAGRAGSMAAAARALGVDKATVSRRLAALAAARPGLYERRGGRVEPTAAGARALAALDQLERGLTALGDALTGDDAGGQVRLTLAAPLARELVVPALPHFRAAHPGVELRLLAVSRALDLARGEADVGLRNLVPTGGGIVSRRVAIVHGRMYASRDYLARRGPPAPGSLDGHDFLDYEAGTHRAPPFAWLPAAAARARVVLRADDPQLLADAAAAGLGLAMLPGFVGEHHARLVRVVGDASVTPVHVVVRAEVRRLARVRAVAAWLGELVAARRAWLEA